MVKLSVALGCCSRIRGIPVMCKRRHRTILEPTIPRILEVNKQVRYSIRISSSNPPFRQEHKTNATAFVIAPSLRSPAPSSWTVCCIPKLAVCGFEGSENDSYLFHQSNYQKPIELGPLFCSDSPKMGGKRPSPNFWGSSRNWNKNLSCPRCTTTSTAVSISPNKQTALEIWQTWAFSDQVLTAPR